MVIMDTAKVLEEQARVIQQQAGIIAEQAETIKQQTEALEQLGFVLKGSEQDEGVCWRCNLFLQQKCSRHQCREHD